jgi:hypothetical protein
MTGSEWEWVAGAADIAVPTHAVARSSCWADSGTFLLVSCRATNEGPEDRTAGEGLRLCADLRSE